MNTETMMTEATTTTTEGEAASTVAPSTTEAAQPAVETGQVQQPQEAQPEDKPKDETPPVPENYEFKAPDGKEFDADTIASFTEVAKELKLPAEAAQKILDKMAPVLDAKMAREVEAVRTQWREQATSDKEFGGEKLSENLAVAKKAMDQFGTPELKTLLSESGLGNHPELIRFFYRAGKAISEDTIVAGKSAPSAAFDPAKVLFPNHK